MGNILEQHKEATAAKQAQIDDALSEMSSNITTAADLTEKIHDAVYEREDADDQISDIILDFQNVTRRGACTAVAPASHALL